MGSVMDNSKRGQIMHEVFAERIAQDLQWGQQNHPIDQCDLGVKHLLDKERFAKETCERRRGEGTMSWVDLIQEELMEANAEMDENKQRIELIQVAALAVAAIESLDRNRAKVAEADKKFDEITHRDIEERAFGRTPPLPECGDCKCPGCWYCAGQDVAEVREPLKDDTGCDV